MRWCIALLCASALGCGDGAAHDSGPPEASTDTGPVDGRADATDGGLDAPETDGGTADAGPWMEDITEAAGLVFERVPTDDYFSVPDRMSGGVCVIEADGRRPVDLFFAIRPGPSGGSRLFVAEAPLSYVEETDARGLSDVGDAVGCLAFDMDGDQDDDLLVTGVGSLRLFENRGGTFVDVTASSGITARPYEMYSSAAAGDVDGDGDIDLLVGGFLLIDPAIEPEPCDLPRCAVSIRRYEPLPSLLLLRQSSGRYRLADTAPGADLREPTLAVAVADLDSDGALDLYLCNDIGDTYPNRPLLAGGGAFTDAPDRVGLDRNARGLGVDCMGTSSADIDGDGDIDHVATDFEANPTALFICQADGPCEERGADLGMLRGAASFRWGVAFVDLDLDGQPDLVEATGHLHSAEEVAAWGFEGEFRQPLNIYRNVGGRFEPQELVPGDGAAVPRSLRGLAVVDLDDDGRPDLVAAPADGPPALLRNVRPPVGHWLAIRLRGAGLDTAAVGARVTVRSSRGAQLREHRVGEGFLGSFDSRLFFGVADPGSVSVDVRWPGGATNSHSDVDLDAEIELRPP